MATVAYPRSEERLDILGVVALGEQDRGAGVPEVMEPEIPRQPGLLQERLEGSAHEVVAVTRRLRIVLLPMPVVGIMATVLEKGKPAARRGRKATGLLAKPGR